MAYKRYLEKEKNQIQNNKDMVSLGKQIEEVKAENEQLRQKLSKTQNSIEIENTTGLKSIKQCSAGTEQASSSIADSSLEVCISWFYFMQVICTVQVIKVNFLNLISKGSKERKKRKKENLFGLKKLTHLS